MASPTENPQSPNQLACENKDVAVNVTQTSQTPNGLEMTIKATVSKACNSCPANDKVGGEAEDGGAKSPDGGENKADGRATTSAGASNEGNDGAGNDESGGKKPIDKSSIARRRRTRLQTYMARSGTVGLPKGDTKAASCNEKITKDARDHLNALYGVVDDLFIALSKAPELIDKYDFTNVGELVSIVEKIAETMFDVTEQLCYSPLITEITNLCTSVAGIVDYASTIPALIYVRLVDLGFYIHEFGNLLSEEILPIEFASLVQRIETHLRVI